MGVIGEWKAGRAARIEAAKARANGGSPKVDIAKNLSGKLADPMMALCEKYGIADNNTRVHCSSEILRETAQHFSRIQVAGKATDEILLAFCDGLKSILSAHGISDISQQESFILDYLTEIERVS